MSQKSKEPARPRASASSDRVAQLAVAPGHERAARRHGQRVGEHGVAEVRLGERGLGERDGPVDAERGVGEVHEGVRRLELGGPVGVHQVGVGRPVLERLEGVADAAGHEDRARRVERRREGAAEGRPRAQVNPRAEDRARRHADVLVPGLGMDAARDAAARVEAHVVLDRAEVGQARRHHLGPLPVLLEPAPGVAVDRQVHDLEPRDAGLGHPELLLELERGHASPLSLGIRLSSCAVPRASGPSRAARGTHERAPWRMPGGGIGKVASLLQFDWDAASSHQDGKSLTCGFAADRDTPTRGVPPRLQQTR